ncbi:hypothetical protein [uncultured Arthrobacter sp.]|uniref:hypothetical protein n=1 Tax=uncultured Arthrobacter sp. TaxID=114050 RepID=UPI002602F34A|nr:hypothetical protein [uncultured Arthrobacter sp.]
MPITRPHDNIEFVWLDSNDFVYNIDPIVNAKNIRRIADEISNSGSQPVFIGGHFTNIRADTHNRQARAAIVRRVAERYGSRYIDVAELLNAIPSVANIWTDGTPLNDAAFALVGTRLAALMGPKGIHPPKLGPGQRITTNHQLIMGGAPTGRPGATDGKTILLTAGQTAILPFDATAPTDALVRFFSGSTAGVGTGRIRYALGKAGIPDRAVNIEPRTFTTVRGHTHHGGPDLVFVTCDTGTLAIDSVDFAPPKNNVRSGLTPAIEVVKSDLSGTVLGGPHPGYTYATAYDEQTPFSVIKADGAHADARIDFMVTLGGATGGPQVVAIASCLYGEATASMGIKEGYGIRRSGASLIVRKFTGSGNTDILSNGAFFTTGQDWTGMVSFVFTGGNVQVLMNGVAAGAAVESAWSHYIPGVYSGAGPLLDIRSCAVQAPAGRV